VIFSLFGFPAYLELAVSTLATPQAIADWFSAGQLPRLKPFTKNERIGKKYFQYNCKMEISEK
jgi:hypothetical protein